MTNGLDTNLRGRINNTSLAKTKGLMSVFEAIVNSIQAIEETSPNFKDSYVRIHIHRHNQLLVPNTRQHIQKRQEAADIVGFTVEDNGAGFNQKNLDSFKTLDSEYKKKKGCRGVGRLLWLKAFEHIDIDSTFFDENKNLQRVIFSLSAEGMTEPQSLSPAGDKPVTRVKLNGYKSYYAKSTHKTMRSIALDVFSHCLWYFLEPNHPEITVIDETCEDSDLAPENCTSIIK